MPGLRVTDVDAVEQDRDLLVGSASHTDVGLRSNGASLADINAYGVLQQIVNTLYRRRLNVPAVQYSYHSRSPACAKRCARPGDFYVIEQYSFLSCQARGRVGHTLYGACFRSRCVVECRHAECSDNDLTSHTSEKCIPLVRELRELLGSALVEK